MNGRQVGHICVEAGTKTAFASSAEEKDLLVLAFKPGREQYGPVNIAVYEKRDGEVKLWPRCQPWCQSDGSNFMIISEDGEAGFVFAPPSLLRVDGPSPKNLQEHVAIARMVLKRTEWNADVG